VCLLFSSSREVARNFHPSRVSSNDYGPYDLPDLPGLCKKMFIHLRDLELIDAIKQQYGSCGLEFHKVPHPVMPHVWIIGEIYVYSGNEIAAELRTKNECFTCARKNASLACVCQSVTFCSVACKERALIEARHLPSHCQAALSRVLVGKASVAKQRMIGLQEMLDKDPELGKQIAVLQQNASTSVTTATKTTEASVNYDEHIRLKRARLAAESAKIREEQGMPPDPNIAAVVAVAAEASTETSTSTSAISSAASLPI
jgi:hypothetical protein